MHKGVIILAFFLAFLFSLGSASAAKFYYEPSGPFVRGCSGKVNIMIDTEGKDALSADAIMSYRQSEITLDTLNIGTAMPMQTYNKITGETFELSGAKLPGTGLHRGVGLYGSIDLDVGMTTENFTLEFLQEFVHPPYNAIAEAGTFQNIITSAEEKTFSVLERYNIEVDGVGFCNPDLTAPLVTFITPRNGSGGNDLDTNFIFSLRDNRAGVDISTLQATIKVGNTTQAFTQTKDFSGTNIHNYIHRITLNPQNDFQEGDRVDIEVRICDLNTNPGPNCRTQKGVFRMYVPPPPDPICGDGIPTYQVGEQCDDGKHCANGIECTEDSDCSGVTGDQKCKPRFLDDEKDTCNALCLWEIPEIECPVCEEGEEGEDKACEIGICGNGTLEPGEQCDDGNTSDGDGCSSTCSIQNPNDSCENDKNNDDREDDLHESAPEIKYVENSQVREVIREIATDSLHSCLEPYISEEIVAIVRQYTNIDHQHSQEYIEFADILLRLDTEFEVPENVAESMKKLLKTAEENGRLPFTDVPENHPDYGPIYSLYERYVIEGYKDGTYKPEKKLSREEFVKIVLGATDCLDCTRPSTFELKKFTELHQFPDVAAERWSDFCITKGKAKKIIKGFGDGTFRPEAKITRAEALAILMRQTDIRLQQQSKRNIVDVEEFSWYKEIMYTAVNLNIIEIQNGKTGPNDQIDRAEFARLADAFIKIKDCREVDTDGDSIPNFWEISHGLDENDKNSNLQEILECLNIESAKQAKNQAEKLHMSAEEAKKISDKKISDYLKKNKGDISSYFESMQTEIPIGMEFLGKKYDIPVDLGSVYWGKAIWNLME